MHIDYLRVSNFVTSIAALLTALGTLLTVWQAQKQRKAAYCPELVLSSVHFSGQKTIICDDHFPFPLNWMKMEERKKKTHQTEQKAISQELQWFTIPVSNIGLGAAKTVTGFWSFPVFEFLTEVNKLAKDDVFSQKNDWVICEGGRYIQWNIDRRFNCDYLLPVSIQKEPSAIRLPSTYINLVSALIWFKCKNMTEELNYNIPPLKITLEYFDIGKAKHKTTVEINFNITACSANGEFFSASLLPQPIYSSDANNTTNILKTILGVRFLLNTFYKKP